VSLCCRGRRLHFIAKLLETLLTCSLSTLQTCEAKPRPVHVKNEGRLADTKIRLVGCVLAFGPNLSVGVKKVGHVGRLLDANRLSWRDKFYLTCEVNLLDLNIEI
jgi:hypothetical protein